MNLRPALATEKTCLRKWGRKEGRDGGRKAGREGKKRKKKENLRSSYSKVVGAVYNLNAHFRQRPQTEQE